MQHGYIIKITGHDLYNEAQLSATSETYTIGTGIESNLRFRKELFFEEFGLTFKKVDSKWNVFCTDGIYLDFGDIRKLTTNSLEHGDVFAVRYQESSNELFNIEFSLDFDNEKKDYSRVINIENENKIIIGTDADANIKLCGEYLRNACIELIKNIDETYNLIVRNSGYGVFHNGKKANNSTIIRNNDFIFISNYSFYKKDGNIYTSQSVNVSGLNYFDLDENSEYPKFNRNTRIKSVIDEEEITVLDPPQKPQKPGGNIVLQLLPAIGMIALTVVVRGFMGNNTNSSFIIFSACSMSFGVITSVVSIVSERKKHKKNLKERKEKYNDYINQKREQIKKYRADELARLNSNFISSEEEIEKVLNFSGDIFDKVIVDEDFLELRIGTGTVEARKKVAFKKQENFETDDELASIPEQVYNDYINVDNAPVTLDLKEDSVIGVIGQPFDSYSFVKKLILDIVSRHYYNDVQIFLLINEDEAEVYAEWAKWLPHIFDEKSRMRNIVYNDDSKASVFERLYIELGKRDLESAESASYYVVFVLDDWGIKTHPVSKFIESAKKCNTAFFFFESEKKMLPLCCDKIIRLEAGFTGSMITANDKDNVLKFTYSPIDDRQLVAVAKKLSPVFCEEINLENALTKNITLFEMLNILSEEDIDLKTNWFNSKIVSTMAAPIGVKTKNEIVYLDLHEKAHGPHGLVAGTTGSGKSEILQTYILAMAIMYHPYEVGFVVIDFKGGGMVNQFKNLPHLIGAITNIDGKEINRSLMSIKAELEKRQRIFAEYNVNNINNYIKLFKTGEATIPVPHLVIIIDEFAELKSEQPEFMKELISAARIGRSLGVHLILATQKPAGQVNEQIWSNSKFKLCLKVQTKEDSNEVLKSPLAAEIKEPGRAYLQVGNNEIFELFQSAYSGAPAKGNTISEKEFVISEVNLQGKRNVIYKKVNKEENIVIASQLDAVVEHVKEYCKKEGIALLPNICLEPLKDVIEYESDIELEQSSLVPIGIMDDPGRQAQNVATINLAAGNTVIIGAAQYGKTNLLQVLIRFLGERFSPIEMNMYILDFGSMALKIFEDLGHVGGVVLPSEDEKVKNLFKLLNKERIRRKEVFADLGITSFNSYLEAGYTDLPRIYLFLDNYIAFKELYSDYEDELLTICRDGVAIGITVIMTSLQTNGINYKFMSNFPNKICMFCNSNDEYNALFNRCRIEPKAVPGRCLIQVEKNIYETQTYIAFNGEREIDRVQEIQNFISKVNKKNDNKIAKKIPDVPKIILEDSLEYRQLDEKPYQMMIGLDYDLIEPQYLNLSSCGVIGISGREKSGKLNLVKLLFNYCLNNIFDNPVKAYIIDDFTHKLEKISSFGFVEKYTVDVGILDVLLKEIEEELKNRKERISDEGIGILENEPLIMCIIENQSVFDNGILSKETIETYKRITEIYKKYKVLFVFSNIPNGNTSYGCTEMMKQVKEMRPLFIMDDLANTKLIEASASLAKKNKKPIIIGDSLQVLSDGTVKRIHIIKANERNE